MPIFSASDQLTASQRMSNGMIRLGEKMMSPIKKVIVIGGGFGGVYAARRLMKNPQLEVTLISKTNHYLFQPLLYQMATATLSDMEIATPLRDIFSNHPNLKIVLDEVSDIDKDKRSVTLSDGQKMGYDALILAVGASQSYFGHPEWEQYAPGLKTLNDAQMIKNKVLLALEEGELEAIKTNQPQQVTFVIVGGGPTGVELAGAISEITRHTLLKNFRHLGSEQVKIILVNAGERLLQDFKPKLSLYAEKALEKMQVEVLNQTKVTAIHATGVETTKRFIASKAVLWAAGNQASPLLQALKTPLDAQGRAIVDGSLNLPGHKEIFVIGDAACCQDSEGIPLPGLAPVAMQQGVYAAKCIEQGLPSHKKPFHYVDKGKAATIGNLKAIIEIGKLSFTGLLGWLVWSGIHIAYLAGWSTQLMVMREWFRWYFFWKKGNGLITKQKK
ncbi:MAG: ndh [Chlamydiales bacterium]|jgi:NADH dehydrogenase|nr:ndh [Chlamydiales bacterium]